MNEVAGDGEGEGGGSNSKSKKYTFLCAGFFFQPGDQVIAVLGLLQTTKGHLGSGNVLLRVLEVLKQSIFVPGHAGLSVGIGVGEAFDGARLAAE